MGSEEGPYPFFLCRIIGNSLKQCKTRCSLRSSAVAFHQCLLETQGVIEPDLLPYCSGYQLYVVELKPISLD